MDYEQFANTVTVVEQDSLRRAGMDCYANMLNTKATVKPGRIWTKVDVGGSGKYMIDQDGNVYGIKAYGVPNKRHFHGNINKPETIKIQGLWG